MAVQIASSEDMRNWLIGRPREEAVAIAARAALRVLPLIDLALSQRGPRRYADLTLTALRAGAIARLAAANKTHEDALRAAAQPAGSAAITVGHISIVTAAAGHAAFTASAQDSYHMPASFAVGYAADAAKKGYGAAALLLSQNQFDALIVERDGVAAVLTKPLWEGPSPFWVDDNWRKIKAALREQDRWGFWIAWYEAVLAGRPLWPELNAKAREDLEVRICLIDDDLWAEGAAVVNAEIERLIAEAMPARIAKQGPGPHFGLDAEDFVTPAAHWEYDESGNIPQRIRSLLPSARQAAADLVAALPLNDPYNLHRDAQNYLAAVACEPERVDWGMLYGLGVTVENAAAAAERPLPDRLLPLLEDPAKRALDSLRTLHLNLIMASGEGRALMEQADALRLTREEQQALRDDASAVAEKLANAPEVAKPEAAKRLKAAAEAMARGPHAERGSEFGLAAIGNISVVLVSAATLASFVPIGAAEAGVVGGAVAAAPAWLGYEALKKSQRFADATKALGGKYDALVGASREAVFRQLVALSPFRAFVCANEPELRRIAEKSARMRWALSYIDFIVNSENPKKV